MPTTAKPSATPRILFFLLLSLAAIACRADDARALLVGSWDLVAVENRGTNGEMERPFGDQPRGRITYTADGSATAQEIVEGLKADFDRKVPSSVATASENNVALTVTGVGHSITLITQDANSTPSAQVVGAGLLDKLIGFSYLDYQNEANSSGLSVHRGQRRVVFLRAGAIGSNLSGNSSKWLDQAYLGIDSGNAAEYGNVYDASGSGRIALPKNAVVWGARPNVFEIRLGR